MTGEDFLFHMVFYVFLTRIMVDFQRKREVGLQCEQSYRQRGPQLVTSPTQKGIDFYWLSQKSLKIILDAMELGGEKEVIQSI